MPDRLRAPGSYWRSVHRDTSRDLSAVCFPDKPQYFNRFFDRIQWSALRQTFRVNRISLAQQQTLDVGCGRGRWLRRFRSCGGSAVGLDLSFDAARACGTEGQKAVQGSVAQLPFRDGAFDVVTSITVLMHVPPPDRTRAVADIARVLSPSGHVVLLEGTWEDPSPHVFPESVDSWVSQFQEHGLRLVHVSAHCFNLARRWLPQRTPARDRVAISFDYAIDYLLMRLLRGRRSRLALQHVMVLQKAPH